MPISAVMVMASALYTAEMYAEQSAWGLVRSNDVNALSTAEMAHWKAQIGRGMAWAVMRLVEARSTNAA